MEVNMVKITKTFSLFGCFDFHRAINKNTGKMVVFQSKSFLAPYFDYYQTVTIINVKKFKQLFSLMIVLEC